MNKFKWVRYVLCCDPAGCDALVEVTVKDNLEDRDIKMQCICGNNLNYISKEEAYK